MSYVIHWQYQNILPKVLWKTDQREKPQKKGSPFFRSSTTIQLYGISNDPTSLPLCSFSNLKCFYRSLVKYLIPSFSPFYLPGKLVLMLHSSPSAASCLYNFPTWESNSTVVVCLLGIHYVDEFGDLSHCFALFLPLLHTTVQPENQSQSYLPPRAS